LTIITSVEGGIVIPSMAAVVDSRVGWMKLPAW